MLNVLRAQRPGAIIVAVLALGGTATAAKLVTGKQIENSSLTGADVKNGGRTRRPEQGRQGVREGRQGRDRRPRRPRQEVLRKVLPAGTFTFTAKLVLRDQSGGNEGYPACRVVDLIGPEELAEQLDITQASVPSGLERRTPLTLVGSVTHDAPRPIALQCIPQAESDQNAIQAVNVQLVATQVATLG